MLHLFIFTQDVFYFSKIDADEIFQQHVCIMVTGHVYH